MYHSTAGTLVELSVRMKQVLGGRKSTWRKGELAVTMDKWRSGLWFTESHRFTVPYENRLNGFIESHMSLQAAMWRSLTVWRCIQMSTWLVLETIEYAHEPCFPSLRLASVWLLNQGDDVLYARYYHMEILNENSDTFLLLSSWFEYLTSGEWV